MLALPDNLRSAIEDEAAKLREKAAVQEVEAAQAKEIDYAGLFAAFDKVKWDEPVKRGRVTYDDKKFFDSLKKQALAGKLLSDRQTAALVKMANKYQSQLDNAENVFAILNVAPAPAEENAAQQENSGAASAGASELIAALCKVEKWEEPVKRGKFSFDDKKFFQSVKKQFDDGRTLSPKQISALDKLATKYGVK
ncbi:MAG: hypothetical protein IJC21_07215 [Lentisphaeria bacterium]|nr:hypothetical protein [Lentisphaeria bacterium]